jgi:hypothetical protein
MEIGVSLDHVQLVDGFVDVYAGVLHDLLYVFVSF